MVTAINNNSSNAGGSRISRGEQGYVIRGIGMVRTLDDLGNIVVTQRNGVPILVRDLGKTTYSHQEREGILGKDTNPDTIEGIVDMLKYQNPSEVLKGIHAKVAELSKATRTHGSADRSLHRPGRPGAGDGPQGLPYRTSKASGWCVSC